MNVQDAEKIVAEKSSDELLSMLSHRDDWQPIILDAAASQLQKRGVQGSATIAERASGSQREAFPRAAKALITVALACLALPLLVLFSGGYVEGMGLFIALGLLAGIVAAVIILTASLKRRAKKKGQSDVVA